jgi:hypothetical protein
MTPVATDFATAMVVARTARQKVGAVDLFKRSLEAMGQKSELENERAKEETLKGNDVYVHNEFLTRFIDVKFLDLSLEWTKHMTPLERRAFNDLAIERTLEILPSPIAAALGVKIDKDVSSNQKSFADFLFDNRYDAQTLVSHRTGAFVAFGLVFHDALFFPILAIFCLALFPLFDSFVIKMRKTMPNGEQIEYVSIAPVALCNIYLICGMFLALNAHESEIFYIQWIFRELPTIVIFYWILFKVSGYMTAMITMTTRKKTNRNPVRPIAVRSRVIR